MHAHRLSRERYIMSYNKRVSAVCQRRACRHRGLRGANLECNHGTHHSSHKIDPVRCVQNSILCACGGFALLVCPLRSDALADKLAFSPKQPTAHSPFCVCTLACQFRNCSRIRNPTAVSYTFWGCVVNSAVCGKEEETISYLPSELCSSWTS